MTRVKIVADSSCDLDSTIIEKLDIGIVPLNVTFGNTNYRTPIELSRDAFFEMLITNPHHPRTSQPSPQDFVDVFEPCLDADRDIICLTLTSEHSGTYANALLCKKYLETERVHIIDSRNATLGLGLLVQRAAEMAAEDCSVDEIRRFLGEAISGTQTLAVMETLKYLERGGRIGKMQRFVGTFLKFKPFVSFVDGVLTNVGKTRGWDTAMTVIQNISERVLGFEDVGRMVIGHTTSPEDASKLCEHLRSLDSGTEVQLAQVGPAIGSHAGPGLFGVGWIGPAFEKEWMS